MIQAYIDDLYEKVIYLCEIRGEMSPEANAITEEQIANIMKMIKDAEEKQYGYRKV